MALGSKKRQALNAIFKKKGYTDYKWIDPQKIIVAQWVRMKCKFGCSGYGRCGTCPPNTLSVPECAQFFKEYSDAVLLHFESTMKKPEDRHPWSAKINAKLLKLEREVFLAGYERTFLLFMDSCYFCKDCSGERQTCQKPSMARPAPEAMAMDVYSTVRQFGFPINVRTAYNQKMDRYEFLMVH
jgi:predicted metal-binding protein